MRKVVLSAVLSGLAMTSGFAAADTAAISGSAAYRERIALMPGAVLEVSLQDVSRADAAATVLSLQRFAMSGVPHNFTLGYDPALIDERFSYSISAKIIVGGKVQFRTTSHYPVLTRGAGSDVDLLLTRATLAGTPNSPAQGTTAALAGTGWDVTELGGKTIEADTLPTLEFDTEGRVAAHAGCNRFSGSYQQEQTSLSFGPNMAGTMMACPPPYDRLEREFIEALMQVNSLTPSDAGIDLIDEGGGIRLRMRPAN